MVGSYELPRHWFLGFRFRLASGLPFTPVVGSIYDSDADRYIGLQGPTDSERVPAFHALDVRVDKEWWFDRWKLALYLEVQNVYNHANVQGVQYNDDYTQRRWSTGLPILPVFGVRGEF